MCWVEKGAQRRKERMPCPRTPKLKPPHNTQHSAHHSLVSTGPGCFSQCVDGSLQTPGGQVLASLHLGPGSHHSLHKRQFPVTSHLIFSSNKLNGPILPREVTLLGPGEQISSERPASGWNDGLRAAGRAELPQPSRAPHPTCTPGRAGLHRRQPVRAQPLASIGDSSLTEGQPRPRPLTGWLRPHFQPCCQPVPSSARLCLQFPCRCVS